MDIENFEKTNAFLDAQAGRVASIIKNLNSVSSSHVALQDDELFSRQLEELEDIQKQLTNNRDFI